MDVGRCGLWWDWFGIAVWTGLRIAIDDDDREREGRKESGG